MSDELKPLSKKHQRVLDQYLICFKQVAAYQKVYPKASYDSARSLSSDLFANTNFSAHLQKRLDDVHMSADEALKNISEIADGSIGVFWKVIDEWMFNPLPTYEILDEKEVFDEEAVPPVKRISYRVRHVALDMDKVMDPRYSHLIQEFKDSRRSGLSIKTYNRHEANRDILKLHGKFTDKVDVTSGGDKITQIGLNTVDYRSNLTETKE